LQAILLRGLKLFRVPVEGVTCTYLSRRNPLHPVADSATLWDVVVLLSKHVHRVPIVNDKGEIINIISQSSAMKFLHDHEKEFHKDFAHSVEQLNLGSSPVHTVREDTPTIEVFRMMDNKKISGVGVVNSAGALVGNTSGSDLKLFVKLPSIALLHVPISDFLKKIRQESLDERMPTFAVASHDSLRVVINKLVATRVHRVFVANDEHGYKPVRVISITDILRHIVAMH